HQREAGVDHRRELAGEDQDVLAGHPADPRYPEADLQRLALDPGGVEPQRLEARVDRLGVARLHLALADLALLGAGLPDPHLGLVAGAGRFLGDRDRWARHDFLLLRARSARPGILPARGKNRFLPLYVTSHPRGG